MRKLGLSLARGKKKNSKSKPQLGVPKAEKEGVVAELPTMEKTLDQEAWMNEALSIVVAGASGDLASTFALRCVAGEGGRGGQGGCCCRCPGACRVCRRELCCDS